MASTRLDFGTGSDPGRYGPDSGPRHWNCFVEPAFEGKGPAPLHADDGFTLFAALPGGGKTRGMLVMDGVLYVLSGTALYSVTTAAAETLIGSIAGTSNVSMAHNDASTPELVIVADGSKYQVASGALTSITDGDLPAANSATFLNSRIIYGITDGRFFWSSVNNADAIDPLDYVTAEGNPDDLVAVVAHLQEIRAFGAKSMEVWSNTTDSTAPFQRNTSAVIPRGCIGRDTIATLDTDIYWVGDDGVVYGGTGYQGNRVSHFGVEEDIRATSDKSTIEALAYHYAGNRWYVLSAPTWTWAYNATTQRWHEKFSSASSRWRVSKAVEFNNTVIFGDNSAGNLYQISRTAFTENDTALIFRARTAPVHAFPNRLCIDRLYLDFVTGVGLNSTTASLQEPLVGLRWSDDGGRTFSRQLFQSLGKIGEYSTRVVFSGLGITGRTGRIWEFEASSAVIRSLMNASIEGDGAGN